MPPTAPRRPRKFPSKWCRCFLVSLLNSSTNHRIDAKTELPDKPHIKSESASPETKPKVEPMSVDSEEKTSPVKNVKKEPKEVDDKTTDKKVTTIGLNSTAATKEDVENYDPSADSYHPLKNAYWKDKKV